MDLIVAGTQNHRLLARGWGKLSVVFLPDMPSLLHYSAWEPLGALVLCLGVRAWLLTSMWAPPPTTQLG